VPRLVAVAPVVSLVRPVLILVAVLEPPLVLVHPVPLPAVVTHRRPADVRDLEGRDDLVVVVQHPQFVPLHLHLLRRGELPIHLRRDHPPILDRHLRCLVVLFLAQHHHAVDVAQLRDEVGLPPTLAPTLAALVGLVGLGVGGVALLRVRRARHARQDRPKTPPVAPSHSARSVAGHRTLLALAVRPAARGNAPHRPSSRAVSSLPLSTTQLYMRPARARLNSGLAGQYEPTLTPPGAKMKTDRVGVSDRGR